MNIKRFLSVFLVFVLSFGMCSFAGAEGTDEIPEGYTAIYTAEDLYNIRNDLSGKYILMNDIDLSVYENWEPIGTEEAPFTGELDGNGYLIKSLTITSCEQFNVGMFGVTKNAIINRVSLIDSNINLEKPSENCFNSYLCVGLLVGKLDEHSKISNSLVKGKVNIQGYWYIFAGGLAGKSNYQAITSYCSNYSDISLDLTNTSGRVYAGGLIGYKSDSIKSVYRCANFGDVSAYGPSDKSVSVVSLGGITGESTTCYLTNCYNRGNITTTLNDDHIFIGGISGLSCFVMKCYNSGNINTPEEFSGCKGALAGNIVPTQWGFPGQHDFSRMESSYYINESLYAGYRDEKTYEEYDEEYQYYGFYRLKQLSEEDFLNQESFVDFDFESVWTMEENGYPVLQNQPMINVKEEISLETGETFEIDLTDCEYSVEDESIASIDQNNNLVALSAGKTVLNVEIDYGYSIEYTITVTEPEPPVVDSANPEKPNDIQTNKKYLTCIIKIIKKIYSSFKWAFLAIFNTITGLIKAFVKCGELA